jgi:hypothetical protein
VTGVTFDPKPDITGPTVIPAVATAMDPGFGQDQGDLHDLAVITLAQPAQAQPAVLPTAGLLDQLAAQGACSVSSSPTSATGRSASRSAAVGPW